MFYNLYRETFGHLRFLLLGKIDTGFWGTVPVNMILIIMIALIALIIIIIIIPGMFID